MYHIFNNVVIHRKERHKIDIYQTNTDILYCIAVYYYWYTTKNNDTINTFFLLVIKINKDFQD